MAMQAHGMLLWQTMRRAIEERDADTLVGCYAEDAELQIVNRDTTPQFSPRAKGQGRDLQVPA